MGHTRGRPHSKQPAACSHATLHVVCTSMAGSVTYRKRTAPQSVRTVRPCSSRASPWLALSSQAQKRMLCRVWLLREGRQPRGPTKGTYTARSARQWILQIRPASKQVTSMQACTADGRLGSVQLCGAGRLPSNRPQPPGAAPPSGAVHRTPCSLQPLQLGQQAVQLHHRVPEALLEQGVERLGGLQPRGALLHDAPPQQAEVGLWARRGSGRRCVTLGLAPHSRGRSWWQARVACPPASSPRNSAAPALPIADPNAAPPPPAHPAPHPHTPLPAPTLVMASKPGRGRRSWSTIAYRMLFSQISGGEESRGGSGGGRGRGGDGKGRVGRFRQPGLRHVLSGCAVAAGSLPGNASQRAQRTRVVLEAGHGPLGGSPHALVRRLCAGGGTTGRGKGLARNSVLGGC